MTVLVIIGASGSGKTTIGQALSRRLNFEFIEGDEFHSRANREKMHAGLPLNDADRKPWLEALRSRIVAMLARKGNAVLTASALRQSYRDVLSMPGVKFIYLRVSESVARARTMKRRASSALLESQFTMLEEPQDAIVVDADAPDLEVAQQIIRGLAAAATAEARAHRRAAMKA